MIWGHLVGALAVRLLLCLYAEYHDFYASTRSGGIGRVKYTDIDYEVFTGGARHLAAGESPYRCDGYRYTPLVAYFMLPNVNVHPLCGKILLCLADVAVGAIIFVIVSYDKLRRRTNATLSAIIWLYNPFTIAISSRGSFEPVQCILVHMALLLALRRSYLLCGLVWGLSVHVKMYTVIYGLSFYIWANTYTATSCFRDMLIPNGSRLLLALGALLGFGIPTGFFYFEYGYEFVNETFLYHVTREDLQHNFSPLFYPLRLLSQSAAGFNSSNAALLTGVDRVTIIHQRNISDQDNAALLGYVTELLTAHGFLLRKAITMSLTAVQLIFVTRAAFRYAVAHLPFAIFCQTAAFVLLNRVATSQYFVWYLCLLPLVLHRLAFSLLAWTFVGVAWLSAQAQWLWQAYYFEFEKRDNLHLVFIASLIYVASHGALLWTIMRRYDALLMRNALHRQQVRSSDLRSLAARSSLFTFKGNTGGQITAVPAGGVQGKRKRR